MESPATELKAAHVLRLSHLVRSRANTETLNNIHQSVHITRSGYTEIPSMKLKKEKRRARIEI